DPESAGTGCNVTMVQSFHNLFVAWSDDKGATWTPQLAYDAGVGHDASTPFASFTLDTRGNPYIGFTTPGPSDNPVTCAAESTAPLGKFDPGGCGGPGPTNGNPTFYPPACKWNLYTGQSLDLTASPKSAVWQSAPATTTPMHIGDICNLGIFCVDPNSNRNL